MNFSRIKKKTRHVGGFAVGKLKIQSTKHARHFRKVVVVVVVVVMFSFDMVQYSVAELGGARRFSCALQHFGLKVTVYRSISLIYFLLNSYRQLFGAE